MSNGSDVEQPSPIVAYLRDQLAEVLPEPARATLAGYDQAIARTSHRGDLHRAWRCAGWAVHLAESSGHSHIARLAQRLKEDHKLWKDSWFGAEFGIAVKDGVGPGEDIEIQWVDDAVAVAKATAQTSGWDAVPWEELLAGLLAVDR